MLLWLLSDGLFKKRLSPRFCVIHCGHKRYGTIVDAMSDSVFCDEHWQRCGRVVGMTSVYSCMVSDVMDVRLTSMIWSSETVTTWV